MIVLDASVLMAHFSSNDAHHEEASGILSAWREHEFATSVLTLAEFYVAPAKAGKLEGAQNLIRRLRVRALDIPEHAAPALAQIRAERGLKMPDVCVLYAAVEQGAALATFDDKLASVGRAADLRVITTKHEGP